MKYKDFLQYLESNLDGYQAFIQKARRYQSDKNAKRAPKSRWTEEKMEKAAYDMWKASMEPLYNKLKHEIKSDLRESWISFIAKNDIFEIVNEGINDLDFNEVA
ncbi:hypothetical protein [Clostridium sp. AN503]|uniref:hypothetical protein n=1 Tax=Clostridium sp. AN503 TaxID=3160598 RepID=UPI0034596EBA